MYVCIQQITKTAQAQWISWVIYYYKQTSSSFFFFFFLFVFVRRVLCIVITSTTTNRSHIEQSFLPFSLSLFHVGFENKMKSRLFTLHKLNTVRWFKGSTYNIKCCPEWTIKWIWHNKYGFHFIPFLYSELRMKEKNVHEKNQTKC